MLRCAQVRLLIDEKVQLDDVLMVLKAMAEWIDRERARFPTAGAHLDDLAGPSEVLVDAADVLDRLDF